MKPDYDSTVARMAGNIAGHMLDRVLVVQTNNGARYPTDTLALIAEDSVKLARAIVTEVKRTQPFPYSADVQLMAALPSPPAESENP